MTFVLTVELFDSAETIFHRSNESLKAKDCSAKDVMKTTSTKTTFYLYRSFIAEIKICVRILIQISLTALKHYLISTILAPIPIN